MSAEASPATTLNPVRDVRRFVRTFRAGEEICREGDRGASMFVIIRGNVEVSASRGATAQRILQLEEGDTFGEIALVETGVRTATVTALATPTEVVEIDRARFIYLVGQQPAFALTVMRGLCRRIGQMDDILEGQRHG